MVGEANTVVAQDVLPGLKNSNVNVNFLERIGLQSITNFVGISRVHQKKKDVLWIANRDGAVIFKIKFYLKFNDI